MLRSLTRKQARHVVEVVGSSGIPPEWGFQFFSAGLDTYLKVIEEDYLRSLIRDGGASFKVVVGTYGGGKTHFLYSVRELAFRNDYLVAYCPLSLNDSPFYRLDRIYRSVISNLMRPLSPQELMTGAERGAASFLKAVYQDLCEGLVADGLSGKELVTRLKSVAEDASQSLENPNFGRAVRLGLEALVDADTDRFDRVLQYLLTDGFDRSVHRKMGILQPIDGGQAFSALRSLVAWIRNLKYRGLVILFDEAEQAGSLSARQKEMMLSNLREMVDQCGSAAFGNVMVFYAIPDEHFLTDGRSPAYEALKQRIRTVFDFNNPTGVKIRLDKLGRSPHTLMNEIGIRLAGIYETAWKVEFPLEAKSDLVTLLAEAAARRSFGDIGYKRLFVQAVVRSLHALRLDPDLEVNEDFADRMLEPEADNATGEDPDG